MAGNQVDCAFLSGLAREIGGTEELIGAIAAANTARHVQELIDAAGLTAFYRRLCETAAENCKAVIANKLSVDVVLFDFDGAIRGSTD